MTIRIFLRTIAISGAIYGTGTAIVFMHALHMATTHSSENWLIVAFLIPLYGPATVLAAATVTAIAVTFIATTQSERAPHTAPKQAESR